MHRHVGKAGVILDPTRPASDVPYIRWAKQEPYDAEFPLTLSAVPPLDWRELGMDPRELELFQYSPYGDPMLLRILSERCALPQSHLFLASSPTHAHYCFAA